MLEDILKIDEAVSYWLVRKDDKTIRVGGWNRASNIYVKL